jgi:hypothetical protein
MKAYVGVDTYTHILLASVLVKGSIQLHASAVFSPGKEPSIKHWRGGWVDLRTVLDDVEKGKFLSLPELLTPTPWFSSL